MSDLEQLRAYYDNTDLSESIQRASRDDEVASEVMVSTSIRLPRSVVQRIRQRAKASGVPATTLMRQWVLQCLDSDPASSVVSVAEVQQFLAQHAHPTHI